MSGSKHFDKIAWTVTALMLVLTVLLAVLLTGQPGREARAQTLGYEKLLFDQQRVHRIDIVMEDWDGFINNIVREEYTLANVVIDGEAFKNVGIRGKGNTSLSSVAAMNSSRYSFKIEFDQYDSSLSYHGLDKLNLNNLIHDTTMMKDYLSYSMMSEFGVHAPLCSFADITVNGEDWGLYLAVEGVEEAFLYRNYGSVHGELYKPDHMSFGGGRGNGRDFDMDMFLNRDDSTVAFENFRPEMTLPERPDGENMPDRKGGFGSAMGSSDVKLQYIDENVSSYANIWDSAKTDISKADQKRLMESLKKLGAGEEITSAVDVDQVIRYFVVHNYVCNGDSYTGFMVHNYYLYEEDGRMAMIPWDYNLAFGTFQGGDAQSTVNTPIDSPITGGSAGDRPMWDWIVADARYTELYHQYFADFLNSVDVTGMIDHAYELIASYVEKDPTAFYDYDDFEAGVGVLRDFCTLRTKSIEAQLSNDETSERMNYADASSLSLSEMGSMGRGGGMSDRRGGAFPDMPQNLPQDGQWPEGLPQDGQLPDFPGAFNPFQMPEGEEIPAQSFPEQGEKINVPGEMNPSGTNSPVEERAGNNQMRPFPDSGQMPGGIIPASMDRGSATGRTSGWLWIGLSALILCVGLLIVKLYKV